MGRWACCACLHRRPRGLACAASSAFCAACAFYLRLAADSMRSPPCTTRYHLPTQRVGTTAPDPSVRPRVRAGYDMQTNAIPTSAPGDRAPTSEEPAPIKMTNQHAKLDKTTPVRTVATRTLSPRAACCTKNCAPPHSSMTSARAPVPSPNESYLHASPADTLPASLICAANEPNPRTSLTCAARLTRAARRICSVPLALQAPHLLFTPCMTHAPLAQARASHTHARHTVSPAYAPRKTS